MVINGKKKYIYIYKKSILFYFIMLRYWGRKPNMMKWFKEAMKDVVCVTEQQYVTKRQAKMKRHTE